MKDQIKIHHLDQIVCLQYLFSIEKEQAVYSVRLFLTRGYSKPFVVTVKGKNYISLHSFFRIKNYLTLYTACSLRLFHFRYVIDRSWFLTVYFWCDWLLIFCVHLHYNIIFSKLGQTYVLKLLRSMFKSRCTSETYVWQKNFKTYVSTKVWRNCCGSHLCHTFIAQQKKVCH